MGRKAKRLDLADLEGALRVDRSIKERSYQHYMQLVELDARRMGADPSDLRRFLSNTRSYDAFITKHYDNPNSLKAHYNAMFSVAHALGLTAAHEHYNAEMLKHAEEASRRKKAGQLKPKFGDGALPDWKVLHERAAAMRSYDADHALAALYLLQPPRRLEYRWLVHYEKPPFPRDPEDVRGNEDLPESAFDAAGKAWNYIYPKGPTYRMVLRKHKVDAKQGVYVTDLSRDVSLVMRGYVQRCNVGDGQHVFVKPRTRQPYSGGEFSTRVTQFLERLTAGLGYPRLSETDLRSMLITSTRNANSLSYAAKEELARRMGHGVAVAELVYNRPVASWTLEELHKVS